LPLSLWYTYVRVKRKWYVLQPQRIVAYAGIFYKKRISIVYNKIDHLEQSEGWIHKLFSNATIFVYTAGSSRQEMTLHNVPKILYHELKKQYE
ncbi:MAG: PH domain-containing protein, partial [Candidatus Woesearchaeota archaeon]